MIGLSVFLRVWYTVGNVPIVLNRQLVDHQAPSWQQSLGGRFRVSVTTVGAGNMSYRYGSVDEVTTRRTEVFRQLGISGDRVLPLSVDLSYGVHWLTQAPLSLHGTSDPGFPAEGVWLRGADRTLFLFVADCFPLALFDRDSETLGIFHAGRAELASGLLAEFLALGRKHGVSMSDVAVFLGPGICPMHYIFHELPAGHRGSTVRDERGTFHVDLRDDIRQTLRQAGISDRQVTEDSRCTFESPELFSHRRSNNVGEGRFALIAQRYG